MATPEELLAYQGLPPQIAPEGAPAPAEAQVLTRGDRALLVDPEGKRVEMPIEQAGAALAAGYRPEGAKEALEQDFRAKVAGQSSGLTEAAGRFANASLGGLSDLAMREGGGLSARELQLQNEVLEKEHGGARLGGTLAGYLNPLSAMGLVGRGAQAVGRATAGALTRLPAGAAKAIGAGTAGAIEGAALGVTSGLEQYGAGYDPDGEQLAKGILASAATGGAVGSLFSLAGTGLNALKTRSAKKGIERDLDKQLAPLNKRAEALAEDAKAFLTPTNKAKLARAKELEGQGLALEQRAKGPRVVDAPMAQQAKAMRAEAKGIIDELDNLATPSGVKVSKLADAQESVASGIAAIRAQASENMLLDVAERVASSRVPARLVGYPILGAGLAAASAVLPEEYQRWGRMAALLGLAVPMLRGHVHGAVAGKATSLAGRVVEGIGDKGIGAAKAVRGAPERLGGRIDDYLGFEGGERLAAQSIRWSAAAPAVMSRAAMERTQSELGQTDLKQLEAELGETAQAAVDVLGVDPTEAQARVQQRLAGIAYLQEVQPKPPSRSGAAGLVRTTFEPTTAQRIDFSLRAQAVERPDVVLSYLREGQVLPQAVRETMQRVYPEEFAQLQAAVREDLPSIFATGKPPSVARLRAIDSFLGNTGDRAYVSMIQNNYQQAQAAAQQQRNVPPPRGTLSQALATGTNGALGRLQ